MKKVVEHLVFVALNYMFRVRFSQVESRAIFQEFHMSRIPYYRNAACSSNKQVRNHHYQADGCCHL